jgi:hypothetical protein
MPDRVTVRLEDWEYDWAVHVGKQVTLANRGKKDARHYPDRSVMQDDETANIMSAVAEMAVAKATNRYWSGSYWPAARHEELRGGPDVGDNIEVRRTRRRDGHLPIRQRDVNLGRICFSAYVHDDMRTVTVNGWIAARTGYEIGSPADYDPDTHLVSQNRLSRTGLRGD